MKIPGESQFKISIYDYDRFHLPGSSDTLIGETVTSRAATRTLFTPLTASPQVIDLEDRYFHRAWKALGADSAQAGATGPPKPIEARDLFIPESDNSQGKVYLWAEILPAGEARTRKPVTFERPPQMELEVRIIVWALNGHAHDETSQDYFVKTYLKGQPRKKKETDTHWFAKGGSAQWNWRHKHVIEVILAPGAS